MPFIYIFFTVKFNNIRSFVVVVSLRIGDTIIYEYLGLVENYFKAKILPLKKIILQKNHSALIFLGIAPQSTIILGQQHVFNNKTWQPTCTAFQKTLKCHPYLIREGFIK